MHDEFFKVLKKDHKEVKDILAQLKETGEKAEKTREKLFLQLKHEIMPHMKTEEKVFYPALLEKKEAREKVLESIEEHHVSGLVLDELEEMRKIRERWGAKLGVFKEIVEHHLEEEESNIFKMAEKLLDREQIKAIMKKFQAEKEKVKKSLAS